MSIKKVMCKIKKILNKMLISKSFIDVQNNFYNDKSLNNFILLIVYLKTHMNSKISNFKYNLFYSLNISLTNDLGVILFSNKLTFSVNNVFSNSFDNLSNDVYEQLFNNFNNNLNTFNSTKKNKYYR